MNDAILEITDGTTSITLINKSTGLHLIAWVPNISDYKGGGIFTDPPLADWRQLKAGKWATVEENFTLTASGPSPDNTAYMMQELRRLLEKANAYWTTDWQNDPVWITAKGNCETNTRYTLIVKGRLGNENNYYSQPYTGRKATLQNVPLVIERRAWLANPPGTGTAIPVSAVETYNGVNYGNVNSSEVREPTTGKVYLANKRNAANVTNIHLGTGGANRIGAAPPYDIIASSGSTYFGIDTSVSDSGPFSNLVFDIGTAGVGGPTIVWEYWNGSTWSTISSLIDKTSDFTNTGVNIVSWAQPSNWATNSPGGGLPTGYWVRARISVGSFSTEPTQQNRNVYSVTWPYTEIQANAIGGDITALNRMKLHGDGNTSSLQANWFAIGLRSVSRGEDFTAYLNAADEQNPSGVSVTLGVNTAYATSLHSSVGRIAEFSPPSDSTAFVDVVQWTINNTLSEEFLGKYHAYLRINVANSGTDYIRLRVGVKFDETQSLRVNYPIISIDTVGTQLGRLVDMGEISILPSKLFSSENIGEVNIYASIAPINAGGDVVGIYDIILIPVDEWAGEFSTVVPTQGVIRDGLSQYLDIDSVHEKKSISATVRASSNDEKIMTYKNVTNGAAILQSNSRQRLWILSKSISETALVDDLSEVEAAFAIEVSANARYFAQRGGR